MKYLIETSKKIIYIFFSDIFSDLAIFILGFIYAISHNKGTNIYTILGITISFIGLFFWVLSRIHLGKSFSVKPEVKELIKTGIYSKIRNPIYIFSTITYGGVLLIFHRILFLFLFILSIFLQTFRAKKEQTLLSKSFGKEYEEYKKHTWF